MKALAFSKSLWLSGPQVQASEAQALMLVWVPRTYLVVPCKTHHRRGWLRPVFHPLSQGQRLPFLWPISFRHDFPWLIRSTNIRKLSLVLGVSHGVQAGGASEIHWEEGKIIECLFIFIFTSSFCYLYCVL